MTRIERNIAICGPDRCALTKAVVDNGAEITIIPKILADSLDLALSGKTFSLRSASGHDSEAKEAKADVRVNRTSCASRVKVAVAQDPKFDHVLLGNDFMNRTKMIIDHGVSRLSCPISSAKRSKSKSIITKDCDPPAEGQWFRVCTRQNVVPR